MNHHRIIYPLCGGRISVMHFFCLSFQIIFSEDYQRVEDLAWHRKHFICEGCEQLLSGRAYIVTKGQLLCPTCSKSKRSWRAAHPQPAESYQIPPGDWSHPMGRMPQPASSAYSKLSGGRSLRVSSFKTRGILRSLRMDLLFPSCNQLKTHWYPAREP